MDKLSDNMFAHLMNTQKHKRHTFCFDKCLDSFEKEVTSGQQDCISISLIIQKHASRNITLRLRCFVREGRLRREKEEVI